MEYVLIAGAKSDIGKSVAREYAKHGYNLYLAARNSTELTEFTSDIKIRNSVEVAIIELDILDYASHQHFFDALPQKLMGIILLVGYLGDQNLSEKDPEEARLILNTNFMGPVNLINIFATYFEQKKEGFIVGVSSVAGDRGRKSNYHYGSAKGGFTIYLSGLRNRLSGTGVHILTVKPGFVATKMTKGMNLPKRLTAHPEEVARDIYRAQQKGKNILYTKWYWRYFMLIIKNIPEFIFKKLNL